MDGDAWTVVGGPRAGKSVRSGRPEQLSSVSACKALEGGDDQPGWGSAPGNPAANSVEGNQPAPAKGRRRNRRQEETLEERVKRLTALVEACRCKQPVDCMHAVSRMHQCG